MNERRVVSIPFARKLEPPADGDRLVSVSVTPAGEALALWASELDRQRLQAQDETPGGTFARTRPDKPVPVRVTIDGLHRRQSVRRLELQTNFPTAHVLPGARVLVVGARARWRAEGPEHNAYVYGPDGSLERSTCVGDGVEHVVTTRSGRIWIGYFDEGVFGNFGWGGPGPEPIGAPGLNRFDPELKLEWSHPERDICDCYAITTSDEDCLVCAYTDWAVQRVSGYGKVSLFANDVPGASAMVEQGGRVALVGGYDEERDRVVLGSLQDGALRVDASGRVRLSTSEKWAGTTVIGRDGVLHAFDDTAWHAMRLDALARELGV